MPAHRLAAQPAYLKRFDVVGEDSDLVPDFVCHVGLALEAKDAVSSGEEVPVRHMAPPIENRGRMCAHSIGTAGLTVDKANQIELFLNEIESEYDAAPGRPNRLQQYVIVPHVKPWCAKDGTTLWLRFSCAGLVIESYGDAGIDLVDDSEDSLPLVTAETLDQAYPDLAPIKEIGPNLRESLGIPGDGAWPVVLAGYVLHALNRTIEDIRSGPYKPADSDATFP